MMKTVWDVFLNDFVKLERNFIIKSKLEDKGNYKREMKEKKIFKWLKGKN